MVLKGWLQKAKKRKKKRYESNEHNREESLSKEKINLQKKKENNERNLVTVEFEWKSSDFMEKARQREALLS